MEAGTLGASEAGRQCMTSLLETRALFAILSDSSLLQRSAAGRDREGWPCQRERASQSGTQGA